MTFEEIVESRSITEVLHFTTNKGLLGVLFMGKILSRQRLQQEDTLEFIFTPNAIFRKDPAWLDYVNMSISEINSTFFEIASGRWHRGERLWWCILSFSAEILTHDGVVFTTTNNMYSGVKRKPGPEGLEAMFAARILHYNNKRVRRAEDRARCLPTCEQAEVLYPKGISTQHLKRIYVVRDEDMDDVRAQIAVIQHPEVEVVKDPARFRGATE